MPPRRRRAGWRRWLWRGLLGLLALLLLLRLALPWIVPFALERVAASHGLEARLARLEVALLPGEIGLTGLALRDPELARDVVQLGFVRAHLAWGDLLVGRLRLYRIDIDDLSVELERDPEGRWSWLERFAVAEEDSAKQTESGSDEADAREEQRAAAAPRLAELLDLPVQIDDARLHRVRVRWRDELGGAPLETELRLALRASGLGVQGATAALELDLSAEPGLRSATLAVRASNDRDALRAEVAFDVRGADARPFERYLRPLGIEVPREELALGWRAAALLHDDERSFLHGMIELREVRYAEGGRAVAELDAVRIQTNSIAAEELAFERIELAGLEAGVATSADGALRFGGWTLRPPPPSASAALATNADSAPRSPSGAASAASATSTRADPAPPARSAVALLPFESLPRVRVDRVQLADLHVHARLEALALDQGFALERLELRGIDSRPAPGQAPAVLLLRAAAPGLVEHLRLDGRITTAPRALSAELALDAEELRPAAVDALLTALGLAGIGVEARRFRAELAAGLDEQDAEHPRAEIALRELRIEGAAGESLLALDEARAAIVFERAANRVVIDASALSGLAARARRSADGGIHVAGLRLAPTAVPAAASATPESSPAGAAPTPGASARAAEIARVAEPTAAPPQLFLRALDVGGIALALEDETGELGATFELADLRIEARELHYPARSAGDAAAGRLRIRALLPGLVERLELAGDVHADPVMPRFSLAIEAGGVTAARAAALLAAAGVRSELRDGRFAARLEGELTLEPGGLRAPLLRVEELDFADGERALFALDEARLEDLVLARDAHGAPTIDIGRASWRALRTAAELRQDGSAAALGFALVPPAVAPAIAPTAASRPGAPTTPATDPAKAPHPAPSALLAPGPPTLRIAALELGSCSLELADVHGVRWPLELEVRGNALAFAPESVERERGRVEITARVAGSLEELSLSTAFHASPERMEATTELRSRGIDLRRLEAHLRPLGVTGELRSGSAGLALEARLRRRGEVLEGELALRDLALTDGEREWLGCDVLEARGLRLEPSLATIGDWKVERPRAAVELRADGSTALAGLTFGAPPVSEAGRRAAPSAAEAPAAQPASPPAEGSSAAAPGASSAVPGPAPAAPRRELALLGFALSGAELRLIDRRAEQPIELPIELAARLGALRIGVERGRAPLEVDLAARPGATALRVRGEVGATFDSAAFGIDLGGEALDLARVRAFLPPTLLAHARDGELAARLEGELQRDPTTERLALAFTARDLRWSERGAPHPWLALDRLEARLAHDPSADTIAIDTLRCEGLEASVEHERGTYRALGVEFVPPPTPPALTPAEPSPVPAPLEQPAEPSESGPAARASRGDAPFLAGRSAPLPRIQVRDLHLEVAALRWVDRASAENSGSGEVALTIRNLDARGQAAPIECLGANYGEGRPIHLHAEGRVLPGIGSFGLDLETAPFAERPHAELGVAVHGIDAPALRAAAPVLLEALRAEQLVGASLEGEIEAELAFPRRGPLDFALDRRFGALLEVRRFHLKDGRGTVLAGVEEWLLEAPRIELARGFVEVRRCDFTRPEVHVTRSARGLEAAGWILADAPPPSAAGETSHASVAPSAALEEAAPSPPMVAATPPPLQPVPRGAPAPAPTAPPSFVVELDELQILEGVVSFRDERVEPPLVLPLHSIDLAVQNATSAPGPESLPVGLQLRALAGDVDLPERATAGPIPGLGFVTGVLGGIADTVVGTGGPIEREPRPLFQELSAEALLTPTWPPRGHVSMDLAGFELSALTATAKAASVDIADGVLDATIRTTVDPRGNARGRNLFFFSHLDIDEPAGGPIQRYLKLPAPLNVIVFAVTDDTGAVRIPVDFDQHLGSEMTQGQVLGIAIDSLARTLQHALERSAFRVVGFVTDFGDSVIGGLPIVGSIWAWLFSSTVPEEALEPIVIRFAPGDTFLSDEAQASIEAMIERLRNYPKMDVIVEHHSGQADLERARILASPSRADLLDLGARLDGEIEHASRAREVLLAQAEAAILAGRSDDAAQARRELRERDVRLGELFETKRSTLIALGKNRPAQLDRRTRSVQTMLGSVRGELVKNALLEAARELEARVRVPRSRPSKSEGEGGGVILLKPALRRR